MFSLFKKPKKYRNKHDIDDALYLYDFYRAEVIGSGLIDESSIDLAVDHLMEKIDLFSDGTNLTDQEKKELGYNSNLKITKEYLRILSPGARETRNPKDVIKNIQHIAFGKYSRSRHINSLKEICQKKYVINVVDDGRTCNWCLDISGKEIDISIDPNRLIAENCKCIPFNRCAVSIVSNGFV